jgi:hypothetical protein
MTMRRACAGCHIPLDGRGAVTDMSQASHGLCAACASAVRLEFRGKPKCNLLGPWGECNLSASHAGPCRRLTDQWRDRQ